MEKCFELTRPLNLQWTLRLLNWVAWNLAGEPRADDERMMELLAPYAGRRGQVARLIKLGGEKAPRYGPRRPLVDIRKL